MPIYYNPTVSFTIQSIVDLIAPKVGLQDLQSVTTVGATTTNTVTFSSDIKVTGRIYDSGGGAGNAGNILSSLGTGTAWIANTPGGVTSVAQSHEGNAFSVAGTHITSAGTLAIEMEGSELQYINGLGNLVLLSTLPQGAVTNLTTTGTSGVSTLISGVLNVPNYTLLLAEDGTRGGVQIGYTEAGKNYPVELSGEKMFVNVPWTDTPYTLPVTTSSALGGIKICYTDTGKNYAVGLDNDDEAFVNVPWTDTGVLSISTDVNSTGTWTIPLVAGTIDGSRNILLTSNVFGGGTKVGYVPANSDGTQFLKGDGTWGSIPSGLNYEGVWDARNIAEGGVSDGGDPNLTATGLQGDGILYICTIAGSAEPNGSGVAPSAWSVGDWCVYSGVAGSGAWTRVPATNAGVTTFSSNFTSTGASDLQYISGNTFSGKTGAVDLSRVNLNATGTASATTFLRGDNAWETAVTNILASNGLKTSLAANGAITTTGTISVNYVGTDNIINVAADFIPTFSPVLTTDFLLISDELTTVNAVNSASAVTVGSAKTLTITSNQSSVVAGMTIHQNVASLLVYGTVTSVTNDTTFICVITEEIPASEAIQFRSIVEAKRALVSQLPFVPAGTAFVSTVTADNGLKIGGTSSNPIVEASYSKAEFEVNTGGVTTQKTFTLTIALTGIDGATVKNIAGQTIGVVDTVSSFTVTCVANLAFAVVDGEILTFSTKPKNLITAATTTPLGILDADELLVLNAISGLVERKPVGDLPATSVPVFTKATTGNPNVNGTQGLVPAPLAVTANTPTAYFLNSNVAWSTAVTNVAELTLGTNGTDLSSTVANPTGSAVISLQVPSASSANRGALTAANWTTFNNKVTSVNATASGNGTGGIIVDNTDTKNPTVSVNYTTGGGDIVTDAFAQSGTAYSSGSFTPTLRTQPTNQILVYNKALAAARVEFMDIAELPFAHYTASGTVTGVVGLAVANTTPASNGAGQGGGITVSGSATIPTVSVKYDLPNIRATDTIWNVIEAAPPIIRTIHPDCEILVLERNFASALGTVQRHKISDLPATTISNFTVSTASAVGTAGLVPAPAIATQGGTYYLNGNATFTVPPNTMGTGFTVSADTNTATTTITQGDTLTLTGVTNVTTVSNPDGTITINSTDQYTVTVTSVGVTSGGGGVGGLKTVSGSAITGAGTIGVKYVANDNIIMDAESVTTSGGFVSSDEFIMSVVGTPNEVRRDTLCQLKTWINSGQSGGTVTSVTGKTATAAGNGGGITVATTTSNPVVGVYYGAPPTSPNTGIFNVISAALSSAQAIVADDD